MSEPFAYQPFEDLKKIIQSRGIKLTDRPAAIKRDDPLNDDELFAEAMKRVREIKEFRIIPFLQRKSAPARICQINSPDSEVLKAMEEIVRGVRAINLPDTQEYIEWINRADKGNLLQRLHEGQFSVQDFLDLHGRVVAEAESEVDNFIKESLNKRYRCIKIIHGRGLRSSKGPVLKEALVKWLSVRYRKNVLAFVSARQCDGGLGALYILLK